MMIRLGTLLSLMASLGFGTLYYLCKYLHTMTGTEIFGWRVILMLPFMTIFLLHSGDWKHVRDIVQRVRRHPLLLLGLCVSSFLSGIQQWVFLWAPLNGAALDVSLGYFLLPLTLLIWGRIAYREHMSYIQTLSALIASVGVGHAITQSGGLTWEVLLVSLGFPVYFMTRRALHTNNLGGLWCDTALCVPVAVACILARHAPLEHFQAHPSQAGLMLVVGAIGAGAFMAYTSASRLLPTGVFGLLGYVEPALLLCVSLLIGEKIRTEDLLTYGPIIIAVFVLALEGLFALRRLVGVRINPPQHQSAFANDNPLQPSSD